jgi:hypothetical protein
MKDDGYKEFINAVLCVAFVIPFATFTVLKTSSFNRTKIKAAITLLCIGLVLFATKYYVKLEEVKFQSFTTKKIILCLSIVSLNFILTSVLLFTEKWWKEFDFVKYEVTEEVSL